MSIKKRYGALLLFVAIYQVLFFIPLISAPSVASTNDAGMLSALIFGVSPHAFHYQSLGLLPFVFGTLFVSFVGMAYKPWRDLDKQGSLGAKKKKAISGHLTYLFGFVMSLTVSFKTGYPIMGVQFWFVVIELMFALQTLKLIFDKVQDLKVASSGLTVFFGLNIVTLFIRDLTVIGGLEFTAIEIVMLFSTVYLGAVTVYFTYRFIFGKIMLPMVMNKAAQGSSVLVPLVAQYSQSGIMPVIFSLMLTSLVSAFLYPGVVGDPIFSHMLTAIVFLFLLTLTSFYFTHQKVSPSDLMRILSLGGVSLAGKTPSDASRALKNSLATLRNKLVVYQVLFLFGMVFGQSLWTVWSKSADFPVLGFVAGINWFLLMTVYADMSKQYDKLRISS